ncbi:hypothetical protein [Paenibacillus tyrfis]|uniref:Zinc-finger domain-containing protein n=1 Tax=Paenibacillus tyrfis TaxID=1501230 RepID=A0A081P1I3_9BACL|nr:hypothetical protein [Paenibacillus tyrfis]KEQ24556.1 hypothetical protein ET33_07345 [Paenibacillus tyrfis]
MTIMHPNDQELLRFLNKSCSELEYHRIARHMKACAPCRGRLSDFLDVELMLDQLAVEQAPAELADRVMSALRSSDRPLPDRPVFEAQPSSPRRKWVPYWRTELLHGMVAMAATFLFIISGVFGKLTSLDPNRWEADVRTGALQLFHVVESVSRQLLS